jgi:hypothetical protein
MNGRDNLTSASNIHTESIVDPLMINHVLDYIVQYHFHFTVEKSAVISTPTFKYGRLHLFLDLHNSSEYKIINSERPFTTLLLASAVTYWMT